MDSKVMIVNGSIFDCEGCIFDGLKQCLDQGGKSKINCKRVKALIKMNEYYLRKKKKNKIVLRNYEN
jgi:hypothetical protein